MLTSHNRYPFSAITERKDYNWPEGKRLAAYFVLNVEHFQFGLPPGGDFTSVSLPPYHRSYAWRDYGNRVGIWWLLDLFNELELPLALLVNSAIYDHCPEVLVPWRERGDEIVAHGRTNSERQGDMPEAEERALIAEATGALTRAEGKPPAGWLGPWISQSMVTPDLLKEAGYSYMLDWFFDDQPIWCATRSGPLLAVPYPAMELNDSTAIVYRRMGEPDFNAMIVDQFDEQLAQSARQPLVFTLSLHTFIVGQPYRLRSLRRALEHLAAYRDRVWFTHPGKIAAHVAALPPGTVPGG